MRGVTVSVEPPGKLRAPPSIAQATGIPLLSDVVAKTKAVTGPKPFPVALKTLEPPTLSYWTPATIVGAAKSVVFRLQGIAW